ncbi:unnamed protein product [Ectocarpus sp. 6 AP-2014]
MLHAERRNAFSSAILALLVAARSATAILHKHLSFVPPFLDVDHFGKRTVGFEWDVTGEAKVMRNFVRLTPDRQSKRGAVWSVDAIGNTVFSSVLEFRLSGKGDRFFGDGLALWVVEPERRHDLYDMHYGGYYDDDLGAGWGGGMKDLRADLPSGDFHGFVETFKGLGVIVDTYRNEEYYNAHKDFTIVYNTGNMTRDEMVEASVGCNGQVRFYENRADFDPGSVSSRVKVEVAGNVLTVKVDPKNSKTWEDCAQLDLPKELGEEWAKGGHLGLTASTGQLSDNHDVIRLETYVSSEAADKGEEKRETAVPSGLDATVPFLERVSNAENVMNAMLVKMELMDVKQQEHNVAKVEEHVQELFEKTSKNEKGLMDSMEVLERKVRELEIKIKRQLESSLETGIGEAHAAARGWRLPFFVLLAGVTGGALATYRVYRTLRKSHFL